MAQYCTRLVVIEGTDTHPSVPLFLCLKTAANSWCSNSGISIATPLLIESFLNSLDIGVFSVTGNGVIGITIETENNNVEFTQVTFSTTAGANSENFTTDDCEDVSRETCTDDCFAGLVGLRELCVPKDSKNCVWLDEIGISQFTIEQLLTKNYEGVSDFFNKQYNLAVTEVSQTVHNKFSNKYILNSILEGQRLGFPQDGKTVKATNNKLSGIWIEMLNCNSFVDFYLSKITLFTDFTGTIAVKVYDLIRGEQIDTIIVNSIAGQLSSAFVNKVYKSDRKNLELGLFYDSTGINSYKTLIKNGLCCGKTSCSNQYITAGGGYSDANLFIDSDIKTLDHTAGMSIIYSLQCNHQDWLCQSRNILAVPIAYKLAANMIQFGIIASKQERTNSMLTINGQDLPGAMNFFHQKYTETIDSILAKIQTPSDAKCFHCREPYRTVMVLP